MQVKTIYIFALILVLSSVSAAADRETIYYGWDGYRLQNDVPGPSIGLALSGGGARGLTQVGILKAFEDAGFNIRAIAGTSMGGIVGGLYAAGYSADQLDTIIAGINFGALFSNRPARTAMFPTQRPEKERYLFSIRFDGFMPYIPKALTAGQKLSSLLLEYTLKPNYISGGDFMKLKIPFRTVTTDIVSGREVILSSGNLADAMRSTMAFPLAFTGVETDDGILMDGGMLNPIPVDVVRDMRSDLDMVVAVNTTSELLEKDKIKTPIDIANQVTSLMTIDKKETSLADADYVISPNISSYTSTDFNNARDLIDEGYLAGYRAVTEIMERLSDDSDADTLLIAGIDITDPEHLYDTADFPLKQGDTISFNDIRQTIRRMYEEHDLFSVSADIITQSADESKLTPVRIDIKLKNRTSISNLDFTITGNTIFSDSAIVAVMTDGETFLTAETAARFCDRITVSYNHRGFDLARVTRIDYDPASEQVEIDIDEALIENIEIAGNNRTRDWLIHSYFPLNSGNPLNLRDVRRGIADIYSTDLFDRVTMNILPGQTGAVIRISVVEKKYSQMRLGWHWDDEYKSEEFVELLDDNLFGAGNEYIMHARYSPRRQNYGAWLRADRLFSTYLTYKIGSYFSILNRKFYNDQSKYTFSRREERLGFELIVGQQIARFGTVSGEIRWEKIYNKNISTGIINNIHLRTITLRSLVETINRYPFPTDGKKHLFFIEFAADILGGETNYTKFFSSVESYFPIADWLNVHPKLSIGWIDSDHNVPISEKFFLGGQKSFSGFHTDELHGDKMFAGVLTVRFKLPYRFYLSGRYDTGEVYGSADQIKLKNLRHGIGLSLAFDNPLGPVEFGYGNTDGNFDRIYFSIGLDF